MRAAAIPIALALLVVPLAGCVGQSGGESGPSEVDPEEALEDEGPKLPGSDDAGESGGSTDEGSDGGSTDGAGDDGGVDLTSLDRPTWKPGYWWAMNVSGDWTVGESGGLEYTLVVEDAADEAYTTVPDTRKVAVYEQFWDDPFVGQIGRELNPSPTATYPTPPLEVPDDPEPGTQVRFPEPMFDWPLEPDKTWSAQDDHGTSWEMEATLGDVTVASETVRGYTIVGSTEEGWSLRATYVPSLLWFSEVEVTSPSNDTMVQATIRDAGRSFDGTTYTGEMTLQAEDWWYNSAESSHRVPIEVPSDATDLHYTLTIWSFWKAYAALIDPSGTVVEEWGPTLNVVLDTGIRQKEANIQDPVPGTWQLVVKTVAAQETEDGFLWGGASLRAGTLAIGSS